MRDIAVVNGIVQSVSDNESDLDSSSLLWKLELSLLIYSIRKANAGIDSITATIA